VKRQGAMGLEASGACARATAAPFPVFGFVQRNPTHASAIAAFSISRVLYPPSLSPSPYLV
jgi:hypothetical protein